MAEIVYLLCAITSVLCAALLLRAFRATATRFLLWSAISFAMLAAGNVLLVADFIFFPSVSLALWRSLAAFLGAAVLLIGLIWEAGA